MTGIYDKAENDWKEFERWCQAKRRHPTWELFHWWVRARSEGRL